MVIDCLLITSNIGSIFESPEILMPIWISNINKLVVRHNPAFLGIHFQELGGKDFKHSISYLEQFINKFKTLFKAKYDKYLFICDDKYESLNTYTALGSFYFVNELVTTTINIWNFEKSIFEPFKMQKIYRGNLEGVEYITKQKFPPEFYPGEKWSRKGFCLTRWQFGKSVYEFVNVHLFHDASNLIAIKTSPSFYSKCRSHALEYTLSKIENINAKNSEKLSNGEPINAKDITNNLQTLPFFIFGDFNFRLDTRQLLKNLIQHTDPSIPKYVANQDITNIVTTSPIDPRANFLTNNNNNISNNTCSTLTPHINVAATHTVTVRPNHNSPTGFRVYNLDDLILNDSDIETSAPDSGPTIRPPPVFRATATNVLSSQSPNTTSFNISLNNSNNEDDDDDNNSNIVDIINNNISNAGGGTTIFNPEPRSFDPLNMNAYLEPNNRAVISEGHKEPTIYIQTKLFELVPGHENVFTNPDSMKSVLQLDKELNAFKDKLSEQPINFPPSYPYEEDESKPEHFMKTRCPGWCDRIIYNLTAANFIDHNKEIVYDVIGQKFCMGDHKPVFLSLSLKS